VASFGTRHATLDRHITRLRHRVTTVGSRSPEGVVACRADIDLLLDRRAWLTLPDAPTPDARPDAPTSSNYGQRADDRAARNERHSTARPQAHLTPPRRSKLMKGTQHHQQHGREGADPVVVGEQADERRRGAHHE
jgi:hypothetical protein